MSFSDWFRNPFVDFYGGGPDPYREQLEEVKPCGCNNCGEEKRRRELASRATKVETTTHSSPAATTDNNSIELPKPQWTERDVDKLIDENLGAIPVKLGTAKLPSIEGMSSPRSRGTSQSTLLAGVSSPPSSPRSTSPRNTRPSSPRLSEILNTGSDSVQTKLPPPLVQPFNSALLGAPQQTVPLPSLLSIPALF